MNIGVALQIQKDGQQSAHKLAQHGRHRRAGDPQPGHAAQTEDKDGVQHDVDDGADHLGGHGQDGPAGGLEQALKAELAEKTHGEPQADAGVGGAHLHDLRHALSLGHEKRPGEENADQGERHGVAQGQENARARRPVGHLLLLFPQGAGQQGVDAHGGARAHGDHQVLEGERQTHGVQGVFADAGDEYAVHHVVQGLHQHGEHHGDRHAGQQAADGLNAHFVFLGSRTSGGGLIVHF